MLERSEAMVISQDPIQYIFEWLLIFIYVTDEGPTAEVDGDGGFEAIKEGFSVVHKEIPDGNNL